MNKNRIYWLCQLAGWLGMVAIENINYTFFIIGKFNPTVFWWMMFYATIGLISTHIYRLILKRSQFFHKKIISIWLFALLSTIVLSFVMLLGNIIPALIRDPAGFWKSLRLIDIAGPVLNWMRYIGVWIIIYFMYQLLQQNNAIQKEKLVLENLAKTTELELLKTQLNPHFLFNALNSIKALVSINPEQSRDAIVKLSELLRFTLQYGKEYLIPVSDEMAEVKKYLELEKLRFGSRLTVSFALAENTLNQTIPPAMVLTLAENAVKHGATKQMAECTISVTTYLTDTACVIAVSNPGSYEPESNLGIGLKHITKRLEEVYHNKAFFHIREEGGLVTATIQTPLS